MAIESPVDYGPKVSYCGICGHFHNGDCAYEAGEDCDSYLCCISAGNDDYDENE